MSIKFTHAQDSSKPIACKKLKIEDFLKKSTEVIAKLALTKTVSIESLKWQKIDPVKGVLGPKKLVVNCLEHAPFIDDGGERCAFKCQSGNFNTIQMIFYENFNKEISLLTIEVGRQG